MFTNDDNVLLKAAHSRNWFSRGRELVEESRYEDALVCFEEAKRLGYSKSADAIFLCKIALGAGH
jgi:hypothetical protein